MMFPKPGKKPKKPRTSPIRKSANGQSCQVRLPGVCLFNHGVVLGHLNGNGAGQKQPDILSSYICSACHDVVDGRRRTDIPKDKVDIYFHHGIFRTQILLVEQGYIQYDGI